MSVHVTGSEARENIQPQSQIEASDEVEQSYSNESFSQTPGFAKQGKFSPGLTPSNILNLQRSIGNQAVQRLIARERTGSEHQCTPTCNHVQRLMAPIFGKQSSQIQRHMGHDHGEEEEAH